MKKLIKLNGKFVPLLENKKKCSDRKFLYKQMLIHIKQEKNLAQLSKKTFLSLFIYLFSINFEIPMYNISNL